MTLRKQLFQNIVRKRENAGNQHVLLFTQYFLLYGRRISPIHPHFNCLWQNYDFDLDKSKIKSYLFTTKSWLLTALDAKSFENIVGKGEMLLNSMFSSLTMFSNLPKNKP